MTGMKMTRRRAAWALIVGAVVVSFGLTVEAQRGFGGRQRGFGGRFRPVIHGNVPYDGRFTFARLSYRSGSSWSHDYPRGDEHFMNIVGTVTSIDPHVEGETNIFALDDPELFKYPVAYMAEPGGWQMSEAEVAGLKAYINKGGFLIFDDFRGNDWYYFEAQMSRAVPGAIWVDMSMDHPIFHSFFDIDSMEIIPQYYDSGTPMLRGLFEDNDPKKRLIAIANYNTDMSEFWEYSDTGFRSIDESNEAYKLGVNYIVYGITH